MSLRRSALLALVALVAVVPTLAACDSGTSAGPVGGPKRGGTVVIGAEQEPRCADWISTCAGVSWGYWMMNPETVPHVYLTTPGNSYQLGAMMAREPVLGPGPPQKVTYLISPQARWSDGKPITSADFRYTWQQITRGQDIYSTVGYADISEILTPSPREAVAVFSRPYADWRDLFGADNFGVLPSHILEGHDRAAAMKNGYSWSGGPWLIQSWQRGQSITLVPNPEYWGKHPYLAKVVFDFVASPTAEAQGFKAGAYQMIYPEPDLNVMSTVRTVPGTNVRVDDGLAFEGVWLNVTRFPLSDLKVRQALAYATDRNTVVSLLLGPIDPNLQPVQSSVPPAEADYATAPFDRYSFDLHRVTQLMTADGWARGPDGVWARAGRQAAVQLRTTTGNARRLLMEQVLTKEWRTAGFAVTTSNESADTLFQQDLPAGNFQAAIYALPASTPDPGQCVYWCSTAIPGPTNQNAGSNWDRISDPSLDATWGPADAELNVSRRAEEIRAGQTALAALVPFLPVDPLPDVLAWRNTVRGPVSDNATSGPFWNMQYWYLG